jgi:hypothetical protein
VVKSRRLRWKQYKACMGEIKNAKKILVGKQEGKRPFGRTRQRW